MTEGQDILPAGTPMGRPLRMTRAIEDEICLRLALGESLIAICRDDDMPDRATVFRWLQDERSGDFRDRYAHAREQQADSFFDETKEIADDGTNDWMEQRDKDENLIGWRVNGEAVQRSKLRMEQRKWAAAKLKPKKYGEKIDVTTDGQPVNSDTSDLAARTASLIALAQKRKGEKK